MAMQHARRALPQLHKAVHAFFLQNVLHGNVALGYAENDGQSVVGRRTLLLVSRRNVFCGSLKGEM